MNHNQILEKIRQSPDQRVKIAIVDIDGILRGKIMRKDKLLSAIEDGSGFCDVVFGWDIADLAYEMGSEMVTGWHTGYPDAQYQIDLSTFRQIPWEEDIPILLGDFSAIDHPACPRSLLKKVIQKAEKMGYQAQFSQEFEWFNFKETADTLHEKGHQNPTPITKGMFGYSMLRASQHSPYFNDLFTLLDDFNVPLEGLHTETGPGVYEACIQYSEVLEAADRAVFFKTGVKEIASRHGITPSFMAKWHPDLPGCSGHLHQSLWKDGQNLFYDAEDPKKMSEEMKSFIAGQLHALPYILPMYAPTINSYKRLVEGAWAPTTLTWGMDNRTTALRVINPGANATRVELRVPGSDVNPYLAMAAALASGLYGIEQKMKLKTAPTKGNGYEDLANGVLPSDLKAATTAMKGAELSKELLGAPFVAHFCATREWECKQFAAGVTDWELKRYFEII